MYCRSGFDLCLQRLLSAGGGSWAHKLPPLVRSIVIWIHLLLFCSCDSHSLYSITQNLYTVGWGEMRCLLHLSQSHNMESSTSRHIPARNVLIRAAGHKIVLHTKERYLLRGQGFSGRWQSTIFLQSKRKFFATIEPTPSWLDTMINGTKNLLLVEEIWASYDGWKYMYVYSDESIESC